jgi:hypothetical protein
MPARKSDRLINPLFGHVNLQTERIIDAVVQSRRSTDFYVERLEKKLDASIQRLERKLDQIIEDRHRDNAPRERLAK